MTQPRMQDDHYQVLANIARLVSDPAKHHQLTHQDVQDAMVLSRYYGLPVAWRVEFLGAAEGLAEVVEVQPYHRAIKHAQGPRVLHRLGDFIGLMRRHWLKGALEYLQDERDIRKAHHARIEAENDRVDAGGMSGL